MEKIRKEIHLPQNVIKALAKVAAASGKTTKKYMEELVIKETKIQIERLTKSVDKQDLLY
jgi:hypothetical protein